MDVVLVSRVGPRLVISIWTQSPWGSRTPAPLPDTLPPSHLRPVLAAVTAPQLPYNLWPNFHLLSEKTLHFSEAASRSPLASIYSVAPNHCLLRPPSALPPGPDRRVKNSRQSVRFFWPSVVVAHFLFLFSLLQQATELLSCFSVS